MGAGPYAPGGVPMNPKNLKKYLACLTLAGLVATSTGVALGTSG